MLQAVEYIHHLVIGKENEYKRQVLQDWYKEMSMEKFQKRNPRIKSAANFSDNGISGSENDRPSAEDVEEVLLQYENWSNESKINSTPAIFINGFVLPKPYNIKDLELIKRLSD